MPSIRLSVIGAKTTMPVREPNSAQLLLPRIQLRCWLRLPGFTMPRDGVIDTGSPFTWFPRDIWRRFQPGVDYEELPFDVGYIPPRGQTAGWNFTFRFVRLLQPIGLHDGRTELTRDRVIVQLADGDPPSFARSNSPAVSILGLWGGILENTNLRISTDPATGQVVGALEW